MLSTLLVVLKDLLAGEVVQAVDPTEVAQCYQTPGMEAILALYMQAQL